MIIETPGMLWQNLRFDVPIVFIKTNSQRHLINQLQIQTNLN